MKTAALPSAELLMIQSEWLAPARSRLLRKAGIGRRRRVLDLGCGYGDVTAELARRCGGSVVGVDLRADASRWKLAQGTDISLVAGDGSRLPFADATFELVFCQFVFLWADAVQMAREVRRILAPGGVLLAIEPDFGGMIEYPPEIATRDLWLAALERAGATPTVGRMLPGLLCAAGFRAEVELLDRLVSPSEKRFKFLEDMELSDAERQSLRALHKADLAEPPQRKVCHLPLFLVTAYPV